MGERTSYLPSAPISFTLGATYRTPSLLDASPSFEVEGSFTRRAFGLPLRLRSVTGNWQAYPSLKLAFAFAGSPAGGNYQNQEQAMTTEAKNAEPTTGEY